MKDPKTVQEHSALDLDEAVELAGASCQETQEAMKAKALTELDGVKQAGRQS